MHAHTRTHARTHYTPCTEHRLPVRSHGADRPTNLRAVHRTEREAAVAARARHDGICASPNCSRRASCNAPAAFGHSRCAPLGGAARCGRFDAVEPRWAQRHVHSAKRKPNALHSELLLSGQLVCRACSDAALLCVAARPTSDRRARHEPPEDFCVTTGRLRPVRTTAATERRPSFFRRRGGSGTRHSDGRTAWQVARAVIPVTRAVFPVTL